MNGTLHPESPTRPQTAPSRSSRGPTPAIRGPSPAQGTKADETEDQGRPRPTQSDRRRPRWSPTSHGSGRAGRRRPARWRDRGNGKARVGAPPHSRQPPDTMRRVPRAQPTRTPPGPAVELPFAHPLGRPSTGISLGAPPSGAGREILFKWRFALMFSSRALGDPDASRVTESGRLRRGRSGWRSGLRHGDGGTRNGGGRGVGLKRSPPLSVWDGRAKSPLHHASSGVCQTSIRDLIDDSSVAVVLTW